MITANLGANPPTPTSLAGTNLQTPKIAIKAHNVEKILIGVRDSGVFDLHPMKITSQMGSLGPNGHPTYGYGLGLFFIAVGM